MRSNVWHHTSIGVFRLGGERQPGFWTPGALYLEMDGWKTDCDPDKGSCGAVDAMILSNDDAANWDMKLEFWRSQSQM